MLYKILTLNLSTVFIRCNKTDVLSGNFQTLYHIEDLGVGVLHPEPADDDVDEGDDEDDHGGRVVEDVGALLVLILIDIESSEDEEEQTKEDLQDEAGEDEAEDRGVELVLLPHLVIGYFGTLLL